MLWSCLLHLLLQTYQVMLNCICWVHAIHTELFEENLSLRAAATLELALAQTLRRLLPAAAL